MIQKTNLLISALAGEAGIVATNAAFAVSPDLSAIDYNKVIETVIQIAIGVITLIKLFKTPKTPKK